jgi:phosphocarrier protein HPr
MDIAPEYLERNLVVRNTRGLHARVATKMVQTMRNYNCTVTVVKDAVEVDARSVLGLLLLAATPGSEILVKALGADCLQAVEEISRLLEDEEPE